jgi:uncharacterized protein (TIGR02466 family)
MTTKAQLRSLFPTWLYLCDGGLERLHPALEELTHRLMRDARNAIRRTNDGGWHYAFDLFELKEPAVTEFHGYMEQHVQAFLNHFHPEEQRERKDAFLLKGWINLNREGDRNLLHCHPGAFLSATYYVKVPTGMKGGDIWFRDPRGAAVAMYETPGIALPWVGSGVGVPIAPQSGRLLIFPSWLEHRVEPFEGEGDRISIAFNASNP